MPIPALLAKQTTTTTGTGTLTLIAAASRLRSFQAAFGTSARDVRYVISWPTGFEIGIGTFDGGSPGTLSRDVVLASSNAGSLVSLPAGTADVQAFIDASDRVLIESTATTLNLALVDLGNLVIWTGTAAGTVTLPALATVPPGAQYAIRNAGNAALTIDPNGSETVNGETTLPLLPGDAVEVVAATGGWFLAEPLPSLIHIRTQTVSAPVAFVDFTIPGGFSAVRLLGRGLNVVTAGTGIGLRFSYDNGGSYAFGASDYTYGFMTFTGTSLSAGNVTGNSIDLTAQLQAGEGRSIIDATVNLFGTRASVSTQAGVIDNTPQHRSALFNGSINITGRPTNLRLLAGTGNINGGVVTLSGIR